MGFTRFRFMADFKWFFVVVPGGRNPHERELQERMFLTRRPRLYFVIIHNRDRTELKLLRDTETGKVQKHFVVKFVFTTRRLAAFFLHYRLPRFLSLCT